MATKTLQYAQPLTSAKPRRDYTRWLHWLLVLAVVAGFWSVVDNGFGPVDDKSNISQNPKLNPPRFTSDSVWWYWKHSELALYIPVTYTIWGVLAKATWVPTPNEEGIFLDAHIFHAASLLVHVLSVLAVYGILRRLLRRPWPAVAGALLFGLHPIQVESVAWTAGLKDLLYGMFSLTAVLLYLRAVITKAEIPSAKAEPMRAASVLEAEPIDLISRSPVLRVLARPGAAYVLGILAMVTGMLCKPTAMVTPLLVSVIDYGILRRPLRKVVKSVLPWFVAVVPLAIVAKLVQSGAGGGDATDLAAADPGRGVAGVLSREDRAADRAGI